MECWNDKKNGENTSEASTSQGCIASTSNDREILYSEASTSSKGEKRLNDVWIRDSGETWHMTPHRDWFYSYDPISEGPVYMGNDHALEIVGVDTIRCYYSKNTRSMSCKGVEEEFILCWTIG